MTERRGQSPKPVGPWRATWRSYRRYKLGMAGLAVAGALFLIALFAPCIANDEPLVCSYEGTIYSPAVVETVQNIPFSSLLVKKSIPFRYESFSFQRQL